MTATSVQAMPVPGDLEALAAIEPIEGRVLRLVWIVLLAGFAVSPVMLTLATTSRFNRTIPSPILGSVSSAIAARLDLLLTVGLLGVVGVVILVALPVLIIKARGATAVAGLTGMAAAVALSATVNHASIKSGIVVAGLAPIALFLIPSPGTEWLEGATRVILRAYLWGSLVFAVAFPSWGLLHSKADSLGLFPTRLAGLTPHPNTLGPLLIVSVLFELRAPRHRAFHVAVALALLIWTQSKTSLAILIIIAVVVTYRRRRPEPGAARLLAATAVVVVIVITSWIAIGLARPGVTTSRTDTSAESFTGRRAIWEVTLEVWATDRVFGVGPHLWDASMNARFADRVGFPPGQAHNQLVQSLGESGMIGAGFLLLFLVGAASLIRGEGGPGRIGGALVVALALECFTESPLLPSPTSTEFLLVMITLAYILTAANEAGR